MQGQSDLNPSLWEGVGKGNNNFWKGKKTLVGSGIFNASSKFKLSFNLTHLTFITYVI